MEAVLHERRGGWADAMRTVRHLADRARAAGARIEEGVEVTGFELGPDGVEAVLTVARPGRAARSPCSPRGRGRLGCWAMLGQAPRSRSRPATVASAGR